MSDELKRGLRSVRGRLWGSQVLASAVRGLSFAALVALTLGILRWSLGWDVGRTAVLFVLIAGTVAGLIHGLLRAQSWSGAATAVDDHFHLKDRVLSALHFDEEDGAGPASSALRQLQVQDAKGHLEQVKPKEAVKIPVPRMLLPATAVAIIGFYLAGWPPQASEARAEAPVALPEVLAQLEDIFEVIEELEERAKENEDPDAEEMAREMRELAEELEEPSIELREVLAKVSEMQEMMAAAQAEYAEGVIDANLQALGKAMQGSDALDEAGKALESGDLGSALQGLQKAEGNLGHKPTSATSQRANQAAAQQMQQVAGQMSKDKLQQMAQATQQLAQGMQKNNAQQAKGAAKQLGKMVKKHAQAKNMSKCMNGLCNKLGQCKSGMCKGANQASKKNSLAKGQTKLNSTEPSLNYGMGSHGGIDGQQTSIDSKRDMEKITGVLGAGDSEFETLSGPEQEEKARRSFKQIHEDYEKMSEAVLQAENIPLGYREHIRRYFESIRPTTEELAEVEDGE